MILNERDLIIKLSAALAASISLLERSPQAREAAPSNKMFSQMINDYKEVLNEARCDISATNARPPE